MISLEMTRTACQHPGCERLCNCQVTLCRLHRPRTQEELDSARASRAVWRAKPETKAAAHVHQAKWRVRLQENTVRPDSEASELVKAALSAAGVIFVDQVLADLADREPGSESTRIVLDTENEALVAACHAIQLAARRVFNNCHAGRRPSVLRDERTDKDLACVINAALRNYAVEIKRNGSLRDVERGKADGGWCITVKH